MPQPRLWWEMLRIGLPAGGEFALMFVYMILVYDILRPFGAAAQAGFGIGVRVMQALFLPAVAIALRHRAGGRPELRRASGRAGPAGLLFRGGRWPRG